MIILDYWKESYLYISRNQSVWFVRDSCVCVCVCVCMHPSNQLHLYSLQSTALSPCYILKQVFNWNFLKYLSPRGSTHRLFHSKRLTPDRILNSGKYSHKSYSRKHKTRHFYLLHLWLTRVITNLAGNFVLAGRCALFITRNYAKIVL